MIFLCIYLGDGRRGGGGMGVALMHVYIWEYTLLLQNPLLYITCGSKAGQEVKESFKDKRLYLECCHSGFGQIFQGVDTYQSISHVF